MDMTPNDALNELADRLATPPTHGNNGLLFDLEFPLSKKVAYERAGFCLRTKEGILVTVEDGKKGRFVRVSHEAPMQLPDQKAAERLGAPALPYAYININKMNRRATFKNGDWDRLVRQVHGIVRARVQTCEDVYERERNRISAAGERTRALTKLTRGLSKRLGTTVPRHPRRDRRLVGEDMVVRLPDGHEVDVASRLPSTKWDGSFQPGGFVVTAYRIVAVDGDVEAYEEILASLIKLSRNPHIVIEDI